MNRCFVPPALLGVLALITPARAQTRAAPEPAPFVSVAERPAGGFTDQVGLAGPGLALGLRMEATIKTGAPYLAGTLTEHSHVLADGNRIRLRREGLVARDGRGRVRREEGGPPLGLLAPASGAERFVSVHDPVAGADLLIDFGRKTAMWLALPMPPPGPVGGVPMTAPSVDPFAATMIPLLPPIHVADDSLPEPRQEPLGVRLLESLRCDGTRVTTVIPPGQVGNERPIELVTERWVSAELGVTVESRHHDPRFGTTTYKLTNLRRGEPDRALFLPPAGFRVVRAPAPPALPRLRRAVTSPR
jgi:hypothetical protein